MSSRRQPHNENLIHPVRRAGSVVHTLSSANKIKSTSSHTKENILTSKSTSTSRNILDKDVRESKINPGTDKLGETVDDKKTLKSSRNPLDLKGPSVKPSRTALSSKSTELQSSRISLKPRIASTPSLKTKKPSLTILQSQTPSQAKSGKLKSTLKVYTPGPGPSNSNISKTKSKSRLKVEEGKEDEVDEVEYMPPTIKERKYESHHAFADHQNDEVLQPLQSTSSVNMDLDLDLESPVNIPGDNDLSFELELPPTQDDLHLDINHQPKDDFLLDL
ncbi:hypothetical protein V865_005375 [Kwoniella europaea PYCC6329]|uniref:Uncharacterized protein n=1 Tax=Kwoniella europaea PYCC6329 TaxID=1423913 RepID=A0AAX4KNK6_9TREE